MNKERNANGMSRRQFLQTSAGCGASAMFLSLAARCHLPRQIPHPEKFDPARDPQ